MVASTRISTTRAPLRGGPGVAIVGAGPAGMTAALLLARSGRRVSLFEGSDEVGGLWSSRLDEDGYFAGDNSCKVYQPNYLTAPRLFELIGTDWQRHFTRAHDLTADWLKPFVAACSVRDLWILATAYLNHRAGRGRYHLSTVSQFMEARDLSEPCRRWLRATALGGIAGTLRMTMWEFFHRIGSNVTEILRGARGPLYWNTQPPNSPDGFVPIWRRALEKQGVVVHTASPIVALTQHTTRRGLTLTSGAGETHEAEAIFLAIPPPALTKLLQGSESPLAEGFGLSGEALAAYLGESVYEHVGISWFFDRELPRDLPLGGHTVRRGWHPILVQHAQYRAQLRPPARSVVVGSVALDTEFRHPRLGTLAREHDLAELAAILWDDERRADPSLPEPVGFTETGLSSATQIVARGPLPLKMHGADVFLATNLHGQAPYFTASLEAAIQAGAIAASRYDNNVETLPMGPGLRSGLPWNRAA
jgi:hypothetical protein